MFAGKGRSARYGLDAALRGSPARAVRKWVVYGISADLPSPRRRRKQHVFRQGTPRRRPIDGLIIHIAGFDDDNNVFRIVDVWESREHADRFLERVMTIVGDNLPPDATPPMRESFYELHDIVRP